MFIIIFFIILLALVFIHEFGHFITAKWVGMRVDEFAFGFPPRLLSKKVGETEYTINALPIGGYVSIYGENGDVDDKAKTNPRSFGNRKVSSQLLVLSAGVIMNFLFAWIIFVGVSFGQTNIILSDNPKLVDKVTETSVMVTDTSSGSPAQRAGIKAGDKIVSLESKGAKVLVKNSEQTISFIESHINDSIKITYKNLNNNISDTTITGVYGILDDKKALGIAFDTVGTIKANFFDAIILGTNKLENIFVAIFAGMGHIGKSVLNGENIINSFVGPIGIAKIVDNTTSMGIVSLLTFVAVLSVNLGIFNALPLPALDGGRFLIVILESVFRKKVPIKFMMWLNGFFFMLFILLLVAVTVKDIIR